ncbi:hypothetical protein CHLNCDRAFT_141425 [Chlorella variabilis]|uniref:Uncharacterized protein n=1 Tax=Chlorella variabilis TaxID=554065 RepID=E1ZSU7_CHLVA|nr:hypothetical protein CHLNCDRAFT_141425 [Chlorella variabilis]EFN51099.1 hypothetical protein CHLNCDRAFT_141425 [Chlorella variabilis]|eukprot:XP_005843201.1 hypothetical protein CHLNCDRAFT_141425 [Chlorella variabilis]
MCLLGICEQHPSTAGDGSRPGHEWNATAAVIDPLAAQQPSGGSITLFVPLGVMLGCVVLAALVLALWWTKRLHHEEQGQVFAADVERGGPRCSLESERNAPYLPKIPVIIVLPDNTSMSLGWEVEHTPCRSPTAAMASSASGSGSSAGGEEEEEEKPFTARLSAALEAASSRASLAADASSPGPATAASGTPAATQQDAAVVPSHRRTAGAANATSGTSTRGSAPTAAPASSRQPVASGPDLAAIALGVVVLVVSLVALQIFRSRRSGLGWKVLLPWNWKSIGRPEPDQEQAAVAAADQLAAELQATGKAPSSAR